MGLKLAPPVRQITLSKFGGLFTESDARDLPAGAAAECWDVDFLIAGVGIRPGLSKAISSYSPTVGSSSNWLYLASANLPGDLQQTLAQNSAGSLYYENLTAEGTMTGFYSGIINNARAVGANIGEREYICLSDLNFGSDQPRQWDGTNLDRISQVGPGAGPSVPSVAGSTYTISSISQPYSVHGIDSISWGSSINLYSATPVGTNLYFLGSVVDSTFHNGIYVGDYVYVTGAGNLEGLNPNGTYQVVSVGDFSDVDGDYKYIQVTAAQANSDFARGTAGGTLQKTTAVVQLSNPIPQQDAAVGSTITIAGTSVQQWNDTWTIQDTPTEGQLSISSTSLASNVATFDYGVTSGNAPGWQASHIYNLGAQIVDGNGTGHVWAVTTPGTSGGSEPTFPATPSGPVTDGGVTWTYQSGAKLDVTVFNTSNGNGIFNVQGAQILSATSTTFTIALTASNVTSAAENGAAVSGSGSVLIIDPGSVTAGSGNPGQDPIYGSSTGGEVLPVSSDLAAGQRYAILMFKTRSGYLTPASPPVEFYTTGSTTSLTFTNLAIGPPNVIARVIAITAANAGIGGPYYYIPDDVTVAASSATLGATQTINKTVVEDNTSVSSPAINLTDAVLLNSVDVTASGNNRLKVRELGECAKCVEFQDRVFYIGERVKVDNLKNPTFDGGVVGSSPFTQDVSGYNSVTLNVAAGTGLFIRLSSNGSMSVSDTGGNTITSIATVSTAAGYMQLYYVASVAASVSDTFTVTGGLNPYIEVFQLPQSILAVGTPVTHTIYPTSSSFDFTLGPISPAYSYTLTIATMAEAFSGTAASLTPIPGFTAASDRTYYIQSSGGGSYSARFSGTTNGDSSIEAALFAFSLSSSSTQQLPAGWTVDSTIRPYVKIVDSPIVNTALQINNSSGAVLSGSLYQAAYQTPFETPIIQPNTAYSVRVTAEAVGSTIASGNLILELYSASTGSWSYTLPLTSLTTSIQEFTGAFSNPLWTAVPSDLLFRVRWDTVPNGAAVLVDRIEIFPTLTPYYERQAAVSYAADYESIDSVTGIVDVSEYTSERIRNVNNFVENELYLATLRHTFAPSPTDSEPSGWQLREVSDQSGCSGPLSEDSGSEYRVRADRKGVWVYDGGNHIKISQEIQQIWDSIYKPSLSTIWVKNDIGQQRFFVGVPLPTPNQWLPNAPTNATPATPNVILMCSYLGAPDGREIAAGMPVHVSMFTGSLLWRDMDRKWTIWQIPSPFGEWIGRADGSEQFWLGGTATGQIYQLDPTVYTDDGAVIDETYMPYDFSDNKDEETLQLGSVRKLYDYASVLIEGAGSFNVTMYPETPATPYYDTQPNFTLATPALDDTNIPLNETGNRLFIKFHVDGVAGSYFNLRRIVMGCQPDPRIQIRGWNV